MFFNKKKNKSKEKISFIKNNDDLLEELKEKGINDKDILNAIQKVPRELFVNKISFQWAYENMPLPIDCEQTISQPYVVAYMIDCLKLRKTDTVLEIGTGTGYQTAIISHLCQKIYTLLNVRACKCGVNSRYHNNRPPPISINAYIYNLIGRI